MTKLLNLIEMLLQFLICKVDTELLKTIQYKKISDVGIDTLQKIFNFNGLPIMLKTLKPVYIKDTN
jgi:hypothetical protein